MCIVIPKALFDNEAIRTYRVVWASAKQCIRELSSKAAGPVSDDNLLPPGITQSGFHFTASVAPVRSAAVLEGGALFVARLDVSATFSFGDDDDTPRPGGAAHRVRRRTYQPPAEAIVLFRRELELQRVYADDRWAFAACRSLASTMRGSSHDIVATIVAMGMLALLETGVNAVAFTLRGDQRVLDILLYEVLGRSAGDRLDANLLAIRAGTDVIEIELGHVPSEQAPAPAHIEMSAISAGGAFELVRRELRASLVDAYSGQRHTLCGRVHPLANDRPIGTDQVWDDGFEDGRTPMLSFQRGLDLDDLRTSPNENEWILH